MFRRAAVAAVVSVLTLVGLALPAAAHVTVSSEDATPGSFATITFRVPNEESNASTVGLKIQLPPDHPIAFVSVQPKPGWTVTTTTRKLDPPITSHGTTITEAVSEVDWTGGKIGPGQFDEFKIQAGPLPEGVDSLTFKAIQTYEDAAGHTSQVAWIQESGPGQPEPDHPAPILSLTGASSSASSGDQASASESTSTASKSATAPRGVAVVKTSTKSSGTNEATVFALAVGAAGLLMAIVALIIAVAARQKMSMLARGDDEGSA